MIAKLHLHPLLAAGILLGGLVAQSEPELDPAAARRLALVALGGHMIAEAGAEPAGPDDLDLCLTALTHESTSLRTKACAAASALAGLAFFRDVPRPTRHLLADRLLPLLEAAEDALADAATTAVCDLVERAMLEAGDVNTAVVRALALALHEDAEDRRRAGLLLEVLARRTGENLRQQIGRTVLDALTRHAEATADDERARVASYMLSAALTWIKTTDRRLAEDLAAKYLADLAAGGPFGLRYRRGNALLGLGRVFAPLTGEARAAVAATLQAAIGAPELQYMTTSGRRTPLRHYAHEALAIAVPHMAAREIGPIEAAVREARRLAERAGADAADLAGMFGPIETALSAWHEGPRPAHEPGRHRSR